MKSLAKAALLAVAGSLVASPLVAVPYMGGSPRTSVIDADPLSTPAPDYTSLAQAIAAINATPLAGGDWTFLVRSDLFEPDNVALGQATNGNTLYFRPASETPVTIRFTQDSVANTGFQGHWLIGVNSTATTTPTPTARVVIDGSPTLGGSSRALAITSPFSSGPAQATTLRVIGDCDHFELRNAIVQQDQASGADVRYALQLSSVFSGGTNYHPDNALIESCEFYATGGNDLASGIEIGAAQGTPTTGILGFQVRDCSVSANYRGVALNAGGSFVFEGNTIVVHGIVADLDSFCFHAVSQPLGTTQSIDLTANRIEIQSPTDSPSHGCFGIRLDANPSNPADRNDYDLVNNMVSVRQLVDTSFDTNAAIGIDIRGSRQDVRAYHNSVLVWADGDSNNTLSTGPARLNAVRQLGAAFEGSLDLRANILRIAHSTGAVLNFEQQPNASGTITSNDNVLALGNVSNPRTGRHGTGTTAAPTWAVPVTLAEWQAGSGHDATSNVNTPAWASDSDLRFLADPGPLFRTSVALPIIITDDIQGDPRATPRLMGCDEYVLATSPGDFDSDGLANERESFDDVVLQAGVLPNGYLADSDGDGLLDYDEIELYFTNPRDADSDDDTLWDGVEVLLGTDPTAAISPMTLVDADNDGLPSSIDGSPSADTNDADPDSDNDGFSDAYEFARGRSITVSDDYPPLGDVALDDGAANVADVTAIGNVASGATTPGVSITEGDVNADGRITAADAQALAGWIVRNSLVLR